jgi:Domain of unknown function (DUF4160)
MPTVYRIGKLKFLIFFEDHAPPHVHVWHGNHQASLRLSDGALLEGRLPVVFLREARHVLKERQKWFLDIWSKHQTARSGRSGSPVRRTFDGLRAWYCAMRGPRSVAPRRMMPRACLFERLGHGRARIFLEDGRVFEQTFPKESRPRLVANGFGVWLAPGIDEGIDTAIRGAKLVVDMRKAKGRPFPTITR